MKPLKSRLGVDSLILGAATITFAGAVFFFFHDGSLFSDASIANLTQVGTFKLSTKDVRRRVDNGLTWSKVDAADNVYEGDSVFTGDDSEASITLDNGNVLKIDPKSLVVIRTRDHKLEIDLHYGSLQGKIEGGKPILISQNGKSQELGGASGSEVRIVKQEASKQMRVQVTSGQLNVKSAGRANQVVKMNEVLQVKEAEESTIEKSTLTLVSPENGEAIWLPMGATLPFKWRAEGTAAAKSLRIELDRTPNFTAPFYSGEVRGGQFALSESKRPEGGFYWRIKPAGEAPSLPSFATTYADVPPLPVLPVDKQVYFLDVEKGEKSKSIFFTWEDQSGSTNYDVQLAHDDKFENLVMTKSGKEKIARVADLPAGDYFWRVLGKNANRKTPPWSRLMTFAVKESFKSPKAPVLAANLIEYVIPAPLLAGLPESIASSGRGVKPEGIMPVTWPATENAESYEVEVAGDADFTNSVKHDNKDSLSFTPGEVRPGSLFVRVRAKSADGRESPVSEQARIYVSLPAPVLEKVSTVIKTFKSAKEAEGAQHQFRFAWTPQAFADSYELQWGSDPQFDQSKKFRVKESFRTIDVSRASTYSVRVRSLAADGTPISPFSPVELATLKKTVMLPPTPPPAPVAAVEPIVVARLPASETGLGGLMSTIPTPKLREPRPESALVSMESAPTFVTFKWNTFKGAKFYTIQIASDADFTNIVAEKKVSKNALTFQKELPEGKVFWRVRAHTQKGFSQWSDPSDLNVIYQ